MWQALIEKILGSLEAGGAKALLHQLETFVAPYAEKELTRIVAHALLKGIDAVIAAAVNVLDAAHAQAFASGYVTQIEGHLTVLVQALIAYVPLQLAVEVAKKEFGSNSAEANAAREKRVAGIAIIRTDISEIFADIVPHG